MFEIYFKIIVNKHFHFIHRSDDEKCLRHHVNRIKQTFRGFSDTSTRKLYFLPNLAQITIKSLKYVLGIIVSFNFLMYDHHAMHKTTQCVEQQYDFITRVSTVGTVSY